MFNGYNFTDQELNISVHDMGFSVRTLHTLLWNNIKTLGDLLKSIKDTNLKGLHRMGKLTIEEIMNKIETLESKEFRDEIQLKKKLEQETTEIDNKIKEYLDAIEKLNYEKVFYAKRIEQLTHNINGGNKNQNQPR